MGKLIAQGMQAEQEAKNKKFELPPLFDKLLAEATNFIPAGSYQMESSGPNSPLLNSRPSEHGSPNFETSVPPWGSPHSNPLENIQKLMEYMVDPVVDHPDPSRSYREWQLANPVVTPPSSSRGFLSTNGS